jgi:hypothetical protein
MLTATVAFEQRGSRQKHAVTRKQTEWMKYNFILIFAPAVIQVWYKHFQVRLCKTKMRHCQIDATDD